MLRLMMTMMTMMMMMRLGQNAKKQYNDVVVMIMIKR